MQPIVVVVLVACVAEAAAFGVAAPPRPPRHRISRERRATKTLRSLRMGYDVDLRGKTAFVAGVADSTGYGWAICKALAEAGATVTVGTWPPVLGIFQKSLEAGKFDADAVLRDGSTMKIAGIYPLDAVFDVPEDVPPEVRANKRYAGLDGFTIAECQAAVARDHGKIDILVHSLANGPEVTKPLLETSRSGYLDYGVNAKRFNWFAKRLGGVKGWKAAPVRAKEHRDYFAQNDLEDKDVWLEGKQK